MVMVTCLDYGGSQESGQMEGCYSDSLLQRMIFLLFKSAQTSNTPPCVGDLMFNHVSLLGTFCSQTIQLCGDLFCSCKLPHSVPDMIDAVSS